MSVWGTVFCSCTLKLKQAQQVLYAEHNSNRQQKPLSLSYVTKLYFY